MSDHSNSISLWHKPVTRVAACAIGVTLFWLVATLAESQSHMTVLFDMFSGPDFCQDSESVHIDVWK